jgi:hypothetical protein
MHAATHLDILQPVQYELRAVGPNKLAQGHGEAVLARVDAEFAQHQRGDDGALLNRASRVQDFCPSGLGHA